MTNEQAESELMQIYGMLSEEKKQALDVLMAQNCDQCEVGNPCLYCEHEFKAKADRNEFYNWDAPIRHKADGEKSLKMRDATPEERESIDKYIKSISKPTGVNFWEMLKRMPAMAIPSAEPYKCDFTCKYYSNGICLNEEKKCLSAEPKTGHWIRTISENGITSAVRCSECGFEDNRHMLFRYCPNCGARMVEPQERSDEE